MTKDKSLSRGRTKIEKCLKVQQQAAATAQDLFIISPAHLHSFFFSA
jgi:hypothetical protein